ncbi:hypothetical protein [Persicimonas caeni]|uniref:hypothetical protein n=1 Tax=Persicimonas caeni TaxID=2292766 RepID=UPI00143D1013|nr:hypothetical protein [Persicimonas caeni]
MLDKTNWLTALAMILTTVACSDPPSPPARDVGTADTADGGLADALTTRDEPDIATDDEVVFGRVPPNTDDSNWEGEWKRMTVQNVGEAPLVIEDIYVTGSDNFRVTYPAQGAEVGDVSRDTESWPETLAPDASFDVRVWFRPDDNLPEQATLVFETNDPDESVREVLLWGGSGPPCLEVRPGDQINLAQGEPGQEVRERVYLQNCSRSRPLQVSRVQMSDDDEGRFGLESASTPVEVPPGERIWFDVVFQSVDEQTHTGEVLITSDDPSHGQIRLPVFARGASDTDCPFARADAWVAGSDERTRPIVTSPLEGIMLDASRSFDFDGSVERYEWTILERPEGSSARILPSSDSVEARFFVDLAGFYMVGLEVYDDEGNASCNGRQLVIVEAVVADDIYIELLWETPGDSDPTDYDGTDLDLHYLHPQGEWDQAPWDVWGYNAMPDWGMQGDQEDDPRLLSDDTYGGGPEVIAHSQLESVEYRLGVFYRGDNDLGPSYATVRVYVGGELEWAYPAKELSQTGAFWEVATIEGPDGSITPVDEVYEGFPEE